MASGAARVQHKTATGAVAISSSLAPGYSQWKLLGVELKFSSAPTTSESFTVTKNAVDGAAYDVVLYTVDPSVGSVTSIVKSFGDDDMFVFKKGDTADAAYTNTDTRTYGLTWVYKEL